MGLNLRTKSARRHIHHRGRDGLFEFFVGVVLLRVSAAVYFLADLLVAAAPVVGLAIGIAISCFATIA